MTFWEEIAFQISSFFGFLGSYESWIDLIGTNLKQFGVWLETFWQQIVNLF